MGQASRQLSGLTCPLVAKWLLVADSLSLTCSDGPCWPPVPRCRPDSLGRANGLPVADNLSLEIGYLVDLVY